LTLLVAAHDAGGAEIVSSWLRRGGRTASLWVGGPARAIFGHKLPELSPLETAPDPGDFELVVCGSSGDADLERRVVASARERRVHVAVWLDHWVNYPARFDELPDELWVCDEAAERIALATVPGPPVRVMGNPYLEDAVDEIRALEGPRGGGERVLYVAEPISVGALRTTGDPLGWGYEERGALRGYLERAAGAAVRVRQHPSEAAGKYDDLLEEFGAEPSPGGTLAQDIAWADTVAGCDTMAMVVALAAGRRVISVIPPGGRPLSLPFGEIERLYRDGQA
jgi:hypothetical protein